MQGPSQTKRAYAVNMKRTLLGFIACSLGSLAYAQGIPADSLQERGGVSYRIGSSEPYTGKVTSVNERSVTLEVMYKEGVPHGSFVGWYPNGRKAMEGALHGDTRVGMWKAWHENGQLKRKGKFVDDKEEGRFMWYNAEGMLTKVGRYRAGKEDGKWAWYHDNGRKMQEGVLRNGMEEGEWREWYPDGKPKMLGQLRKGEKYGTWAWWDESGKKRVERHGQAVTKPAPDSVYHYLEQMLQFVEEGDRQGALRMLDKAEAELDDHSGNDPKAMWLAIFRGQLFMRFEQVEEAQRTLLKATGIPDVDVEAIVSTHDDTGHEALRGVADRLKSASGADARLAPHVALALVYNILQDSVAMQQEQQWMMDHADEEAQGWVIRMSLDLYRAQAEKEEAYYRLGVARDSIRVFGPTRDRELAVVIYLVKLAQYEEAARLAARYLEEDPEDVAFLAEALNMAMGRGDMEGVRKYKEVLRHIDPAMLDRKD